MHYIEHTSLISNWYYIFWHLYDLNPPPHDTLNYKTE